MKVEEFIQIFLWGMGLSISEKKRNDGTSANTHPGRVVRILKKKELIHYNKGEQDYMYAIAGLCHDFIEDRISNL